MLNRKGAGSWLLFKADSQNNPQCLASASSDWMPIGIAWGIELHGVWVDTKAESPKCDPALPFFTYDLLTHNCICFLTVGLNKYTLNLLLLQK